MSTKTWPIENGARGAGVRDYIDEPAFPEIPGLNRAHFSYLGFNMFAGVILVTPMIARAWLQSSNTHNRRVSQSRVDLYARAIRERLWPLNGEPAIFDSAGTLVSFQHRAHAIIKADHPIRTLVVAGVDPLAVPTVDVGKPRTGGDILKLAQDPPHANSVASMAAWVYRYKHDLGASAVVQPVQLSAVLDRHPAMPDWAAHAHRIPINSFPRSMFAGVAYLCSLVDEELARVMVQGIVAGEGLKKNDPVYTLRERGYTNGASRSKIPYAKWWELLLKTWNALYEGRELRNLRVLPGEQVRDIAGLDRSSIA